MFRCKMHYKDDIDLITIEELNERYVLLEYEKTDDMRFNSESPEQYDLVIDSLHKFIENTWNIKPDPDDEFLKEIEEYERLGLLVIKKTKEI